MAAVVAMRCEHSPDGGIQWLRVKPWMCSIGRSAPRCTAASAWQSTSSSICLNLRQFFVPARTLIGVKLLREPRKSWRHMTLPNFLNSCVGQMWLFIQGSDEPETVCTNAGVAYILTRQSEILRWVPHHPHHLEPWGTALSPKTFKVFECMSALGDFCIIRP
jgi:hypothetical protein